MRAEIDAARRRGSAVSLFDEGGLEGLGAADLKGIRSELAGILRESVSERVIIRTSPHHEIAVTIVGRSSGGAPGGETTIRSTSGARSVARADPQAAAVPRP